MKRKVISIALSLLGVILSLAYTVISASADVLKPYVPLACVAIGVGVVLTIFFSIADDIKFKYLALYFQKNRLIQFKASIDEAEKKLVYDPELEDIAGREVLDHLNSWEGIGEDLIVMSRIYANARQQIVDLTSLIAPAMLRYRHQKEFIHLSRIAYNRARHLKRWNKAALIAYYITHAYYSLYANLNTNDGRKWVDRMRDIYTRYPDEELHPLLLEVEGLQLKDDPEKRTDAKKNFETALKLALQPDLAKKLHIARMSKNIYIYLADLAELGLDTSAAFISYKQALDPASKDVFKQLYIYDKLGQLALRTEEYAQACQYYRDQLELAEKKLSPLWQSSAHKGLAKALLGKPPSDIKEAYLHAKQALEIVKEYSEDSPLQDKTEEYEIQAIMIDIANEMYMEYCSLLHL